MPHDRIGECVEFRLGRQRAVDEQVRDFKKAGFFRELFDRVCRKAGGLRALLPTSDGTRLFSAAVEQETGRLLDRGPPNRFSQVLDYAKQNMSGDQKRVVEIVCKHDGCYPLKDLAAELKWDWSATNGCKSSWDTARREIKKKLSQLKPPYRLKQKDGCAVLVCDPQP